MADQDQRVARHAHDAAAPHVDPTVGNNGASRGAAASDAQARDDTGARRYDGEPEANRRVAATALVTAIEGLSTTTGAVEKTQWAILSELRRGRKFREKNPAPLAPLVAEWECERCGTSRRSFEELLHHQFEVHTEIFVPDGELMIEPLPCQCRRCVGPESYLAWASTPEGRGAYT